MCACVLHSFFTLPTHSRSWTERGFVLAQPRSIQQGPRGKDIGLHQENPIKLAQIEFCCRAPAERGTLWLSTPLVWPVQSSPPSSFRPFCLLSNASCGDVSPAALATRLKHHLPMASNQTAAPKNQAHLKTHQRNTNVQTPYRITTNCQKPHPFIQNVKSQTNSSPTSIYGT